MPAGSSLELLDTAHGKGEGQNLPLSLQMGVQEEEGLVYSWRGVVGKGG